MKYSSLQQIKDDFQLATDDPKEILEKLKSIRNDNHPDKSHGDFQNETDKAAYHRANDAIEYLENIRQGTQLVVTETVMALMKQFADFAPAQQQQNAQARLEDRIAYSISHFRTPLFFPKISASAISVFLTFIAVFPMQVDENPILNKRIDVTSPWFFSVWTFMIVSTAYLWIITYYIAERSKQRLERLKLETNQNSMFSNFLAGNEIFTKDSLTLFIMDPRRRAQRTIGTIRRLFDRGIEVDVAQSLADTIIARAIGNGVIEKIPSASMSDSYRIAAAANDFRNAI